MIVDRPPPTTDGVVTLMPPSEGDAVKLIAGRDEEFTRWLGPGSDHPEPTACIVVDGEIVGWVDYDVDRDWLDPAEVNLGYNVFPARRGHGYATRAVQLMMHHLAIRTTCVRATLLINPGNDRSLRLAHRTGFRHEGVIDGSQYFKRPVPPVAYTDGGVTIRPQATADLDSDLEAKDEEQIRWLWLPGERERWTAMTPEQQRDHAVADLRRRHDGFGTGPKWTFSVETVTTDMVTTDTVTTDTVTTDTVTTDTVTTDTVTTTCVAYVDVDLANGLVPAGEANISYSAHPAHRSKGYVSRAVRLIVAWLADNTGATEAHLIIEADNVSSLRVARATGARKEGAWLNDRGQEMFRHVIDVNRPQPR